MAAAALEQNKKREKLTDATRRYWMNRTVDYEREQVHVLRASLTMPELKLTDKERLQLIRQGKVKIRAGIAEISKHDRVMELYDFSEHEKDERVNQERFDKEREKLRKRANVARDKLQSCFADEAEGVLRELEGGK
jgi:hypothetical protein